MVGLQHALFQAPTGDVSRQAIIVQAEKRSIAQGAAAADVETAVEAPHGLQAQVL